MKVIFIFFSVLLSSFVFANNMQLQKVSLTDTNRTAKTVNIKMNISWEHSWRDSINWDAAWIIIKYKEPKDNAWKWKHAQLSQSGNDLGTGAAAMKIVVPNDLMGAFFYRSAIGSGNVANDNVKLFWNYGAAGVTNIDSVEVRVFATEMVYVPQGNYCLGDGNGTVRSDASFQLKNSPNNFAVVNDKWSPLINTQSSPATVYDDNIIRDLGFRISGLAGLDINDDKISDYPNYPTGYKSFYCMKYKTTQGQYTDFLNTLNLKDTINSFYDNYTSYYYSPAKYQKLPKQLRIAWSNLEAFTYNSSSSGVRHTIRFDSVQGKFVVYRPDRVHDNMTSGIPGAFSDWLSLRPMTELEFEKACRGPLPPQYRESAWGADANIPQGNLNPLVFSGVENGTEYFSNYDITRRYFDVLFYGTSGGDAGAGPVRAGIFATDTSSRISSGASYYGLMDLSKIGYELVMPVQKDADRKFSQDYIGNITLDPQGYSYNIPSISNVRSQAVSARTNTAVYYNNNYGFRAVRSAPSDN